MSLKSSQNQKSVSINDDGNDITLNDIYAESESQKKENQTGIYDISIDVKDEAKNGEGHNHEIEERDEDIL